MGSGDAGRGTLVDDYVEFLVSRVRLPVSAARICTALLLSPAPLSQADLRASLSLSDGSVSEGLRLLVDSGLVERAGPSRARPAFFQLRPDTWGDPARQVVENVQVSLALARRFLEHAEEVGLEGPGVEHVSRGKAMMEVLLEGLPALAQKALEAGERVVVEERPSARAG
jgi:DNA-binding transcriptional regulator GbsR (MarR family)